MNKLILIVIILFLLFFLFKPNKDYQPNQEQIQDLSYIDKKQYINNFPYPQISNTFKRLSKGKLPSPLKILTPAFQSFIFRSGSEPIPGLNSSLRPPTLFQ